MKTQCYLAVDLGAESGRVMAGHWNGKSIRLEELHRFPNGPVEIGATLRWDVLRLWSEILAGLTKAAHAYGPSIKSVGVDSWGLDFVLLSNSNELLGQPFHYRDARTRGFMAKTLRKVSKQEIFAATGAQFLEINTLYQLLALRAQSPEVLDASDCFLMMPDFFHWCLAGTRVAEFTDSTTTQCFNPVKRAWAYGLLKKLDLPTSIFPKVVQPGTRLGPIRNSIAARTGLRTISVLAPPTHDTASAVAAVPVAKAEEGSWAYISSGTWSLMGLELCEARLSPRALEHNLTNEGGVDGTFRLLRNIAGLWLVQQCKRAFESRGKKFEYAHLARLAIAAPALKCLIEVDDPGFVNPPSMPAAIQAFCKKSGQAVPRTEGALVRCALESLAMKYREVLACLESISGKRVEVIHIVGGGSRNELLNQFTADACNRPVLAGPVEATALGNVLMQARAEIGSLADLRNIVRSSFEVRLFEPEPNQVNVWNSACDHFGKIRAKYLKFL